MSMVYLDYNATAPVWPEVIEAMAQVLSEPGNPSSAHDLGRRARARIEAARAAIADFLEADTSEVVFTSGGTEANNLALRGIAGQGAVVRVVVSAIEHVSVLDTAHALGLGVSVVPVLPNGTIDLNALEDALRNDGRALLSVMSANNETGVRQPLSDIVPLARRHDAVVHVDAVQSAGREPLSFAKLGADLLTVSAHKMGGPQGVGALIVGAHAPFAGFLTGGGQEQRRRAGTENVPGIIGFGAAVGLAPRIRAAMPRIEALRHRLESGVKEIAGDCIVYGANADRLPNTTALATPGLRSETQIMALDLDGIAVSAGAACSSGKIARSHVLEAMGAGPRAAEAIRVSLGWNTSDDDISKFLSSYAALVERVRNLPVAVGS